LAIGVVSAAWLPFRSGVAQTTRRFFSLGTQRKEWKARRDCLKMFYFLVE
jgi:hypothetical protein